MTAEFAEMQPLSLSARSISSSRKASARSIATVVLTTASALGVPAGCFATAFAAPSIASAVSDAVARLPRRPGGAGKLRGGRRERRDGLRRRECRRRARFLLAPRLRRLKRRRIFTPRRPQATRAYSR